MDDSNEYLIGFCSYYISGMFMYLTVLSAKSWRPVDYELEPSVGIVYRSGSKDRTSTASIGCAVIESLMVLGSGTSDTEECVRNFEVTESLGAWVD